MVLNNLLTGVQYYDLVAVGSYIYMASKDTGSESENGLYRYNLTTTALDGPIAGTMGYLFSGIASNINDDTQLYLTGQDNGNKFAIWKYDTTQKVISMITGTDVDDAKSYSAISSDHTYLYMTGSRFFDAVNNTDKVYKVEIDSNVSPEIISHCSKYSLHRCRCNY